MVERFEIPKDLLPWWEYQLLSNNVYAIYEYLEVEQMYCSYDL